MKLRCTKNGANFIVPIFGPPCRLKSTSAVHTHSATPRSRADQIPQANQPALRTVRVQRIRDPSGEHVTELATQDTVDVAKVGGVPADR